MKSNNHWEAKPVDMDLCNACRRGDMKGVIEALEKGANPNCHINNALGETIPIFLCASKGYQDIASLLISKGVQLNLAQGFDGSTPLHHACLANQIEMVTFLISHGCDVNKGNKLERTPLMEAASVGSVELVTLLYEKGANINTFDQQMKTALRHPFVFSPNINLKKKNKWYNTAKKLVELGADVNVSGSYANGVTILHCAAAQGDIEFVKLLVEKKQADTNSEDEVGRTPLDYAISRQEENVITYLQSAVVIPTQCCCSIL
ncbi:hypothetical protein RFI_13226 [Reticulomyxa filosa]|uniref:Uncharacterized protein n=1 Tax=Reticulomyxa filosa TaxID=46433 RepID=X6NDH2_RETFI|nr:hypothetical protein RFI_13226 [Reticulomyxa filosa]|eukprot:ETO23938.1 hypothetical protein RFI_13226 [Reticulomyxa filosa]